MEWSEAMQSIATAIQNGHETIAEESPLTPIEWIIKPGDTLDPELMTLTAIRQVMVLSGVIDDREALGRVVNYLADRYGTE